MSGSIRRRASAIRTNFPAASASVSAIARAVVLEPNFVVLDEPTSALDMLFQAQMVDLLRELQRKRDLTYMFISHDLRVVASLASHLIVMRHGKVVEEGPASELFKNPKSDYTRALFAAAFRLETASTGDRTQTRAFPLLMESEVGLWIHFARKRHSQSSRLIAGDGAASRLDAGERLVDCLDRRCHVIGVGVDERGRRRGRWRRVLSRTSGRRAAASCDSAEDNVRPMPCSCMSLSRGHPMPDALSATCTRPEQSMPRLVLPPHRYGVPTKISATATKSASI